MYRMMNLVAAVILGLSPGAAPHVAAAADPAIRTWHFTALLDGKRIGEHDFTVTRDGDQIVVDSVAHFKVVVAFIAVYVYDHHAHETWRNGCLTSITSQTNENGTKVFVRGALKDQAFEVESSRGPRTLPACIQSFAYWDPHLLAGSHLLNAQTGEFQPTAFNATGMQNVTVAGHGIAAKRDSIRGPSLAIDVWYSDEGQWVALESRVESGKVLRYEIQ